MTKLYYQNHLGNKVSIYKTRKCRLRNYHPAVRNLLVRENFLRRHIQGLVKYLGQFVWININKKELIIEQEE